MSRSGEGVLQREMERKNLWHLVWSPVWGLILQPGDLDLSPNQEWYASVNTELHMCPFLVAVLHKCIRTYVLLYNFLFFFNNMPSRLSMPGARGLPDSFLTAIMYLLLRKLLVVLKPVLFRGMWLFPVPHCYKQGCKEHPDPLPSPHTG